MAQVSARYPDDKEAAILYALILSVNFDPADQTFSNQLKAARILEPIFIEQPEHPGVAHYLIHSYDYPPIAQQGLDAAQRYSKIAPDAAARAAHALAHLHARRRVARFGGVEPRIGAGRRRPDDEQRARLRLHGLRAAAARAGSARRRR